MNATEVDRVKAAVYQFMTVAAVIDHDSRDYRIRYENLMRRIQAVEDSGRKRKARKWRTQLESVKPHSQTTGPGVTNGPGG
jgi:hypothetical protein